MGSLISRFRKQPTTMEQLNKIEDGLKKIEDYKRNTERKQKRTVANVLIYGAALYILACVIVFVWYLPESWLVRLGLLIPLVLVPLIIYWMKRLISRYFYNKMVRANEDYADLQRKKKDIIDKVMETETFNKAKEILSKYAPERLDKKLQERIVIPEGVKSSPATDLRKRSVEPTNLAMNQPTFKLVKPSQPPPAIMRREINSLTHKLPSLDLPSRQLPQPLFLKERSFSDKLVEYLIGDGPSYRYALICKYCSGHNGMALKEEFPFMSYSCCYCREYNPARNKRPSAPRLPESSNSRPSTSPVRNTGNKLALMLSNEISDEISSELSVKKLQDFQDNEVGKTDVEEHENNKLTQDNGDKNVQQERAETQECLEKHVEESDKPEEPQMQQIVHDNTN